MPLLVSPRLAHTIAIPWASPSRWQGKRKRRSNAPWAAPGSEAIDLRPPTAHPVVCPRGLLPAAAGICVRMPHGSGVSPNLLYGFERFNV
jgi:hypothetical protein